MSELFNDEGVHAKRSKILHPTLQRDQGDVGSKACQPDWLCTKNK